MSKEQLLDSIAAYQCDKVSEYYDYDYAAERLLVSIDDIKEVYLHLNDVLDKLNNVILTYDDLTKEVLCTKDLDEVWYLVKETGTEVSEAQGAACEIGRIVESWRKGADLDD